MNAIDVVMPAHEKDFPVLRRAVGAALRHVSPLRRIYVVSRTHSSWDDERVVSVSEPSLPGFPTLSDIRTRWARARPDKASRAGWIYQQLVKLGAGTYIEGLSSPYLALDSDVIFLRPVSFELDAGKRFSYSQAYGYNEPYRAAYTRLFGGPPSTGKSLTAHHMLYDRWLLSEMMGEIERRHKKRWYEAYVDAVDFDEDASISEMDTYGWWVIDRHPELAYERQLLWQDVRVIPGLLGRAALAADFDFVAAHAWFRQSKMERYGATVPRVVAEIRAAVRARYVG